MIIIHFRPLTIWKFNQNLYYKVKKKREKWNVVHYFVFDTLRRYDFYVARVL